MARDFTDNCMPSGRAYLPVSGRIPLIVQPGNNRTNILNMLQSIEIVEGIVYTHSLIKYSTAHSPYRNKNMAEARMMVMYVCIKKKICTNKELAEYFSKHHSTISHAVRVIGNLIEYDKKLSDKVDHCLNETATLIEIIRNPFANFSL